VEFLTAILGTLFKEVIGYVGLWIERDRAEAARWDAMTAKAKVESIKMVEKQEAAFDAAAAPAPLVTTKPSLWMTGGALLLALCLPGCCLIGRNTFSEGKRPILTLPERTALPAGPDEWSPREQALVGHIESLERVLKAYNDQAKGHNSKNGY
jgi:hypothetical protein